MLVTGFIGVVLIISVTAFCLIQQKKQKAEEACIARIYQNGTLIEEIDLSKVEQTYEKTIESSNGGYNVIEVRHGSIGIIEADCPDKLCQKQGFADKALTSIVCLPNRLVIEMESKQEETKEEFDAVVQ